MRENDTMDAYFLSIPPACTEWISVLHRWQDQYRKKAQPPDVQSPFTFAFISNATLRQQSQARRSLFTRFCFLATDLGLLSRVHGRNRRDYHQLE